MSANHELHSAADIPVDDRDNPGLKRELGFWSSFSLAFAFISPIIGIYAVFGLALTAAGPMFWWGLLIVLAGQLLVAAIFAELSSLWPVAGGISMWSRALFGKTYSWFAGWAYIWTLLITIAAVSYGGGTYLASLVGEHNPGSVEKIAFALVIVVVSTLANTAGRRWLSMLVAASIVCEVVASVGIGAWLLIFERHHSFGTVLQSMNTGAGQATTTAFAFLAAVAIIGWALVGFESAGAIAEEVRAPERKVPRAILLSLVTVAAVMLFSCLALILSLPDLDSAVSGVDTDPVSTTLNANLGTWVAKPCLLVIVIGFVAGTVALQAAVSRSIYALARVGELPGAAFLSRLSKSDRLPVNAINASAAIAIVILGISATQLYGALITFATAGMYLAFLFPVLAALVTRLRGRWQEGPFSLGRFGTAINCAAAVWLVLEFCNIAYPRLADAPWYQNYAVLVVFGVLGVVGAVVNRLYRGNVGAVIQEVAPNPAKRIAAADSV